MTTPASFPPARTRIPHPCRRRPSLALPSARSRPHSPRRGTHLAPRQTRNLAPSLPPRVQPLCLRPRARGRHSPLPRCRHRQRHRLCTRPHRPRPLAHGLRPEPFFFRAAPTFPLETDTKVAIDVHQWARISYATAVDTAQLLGVDDENIPEHSAVQDALDELRRRLDAFRRIARPLDLAAIPLDDPAIFDAFAAGDTDGIPAFQSLPMRDALREMRPRTLNDLAHLYVLTLPGPCLFYNDFRHRRNTFAKTPSARAERAPHPSADAQCDNLPAAGEAPHMGMDAGSRPAWLTALAETHGILLWQEQALALLRDLAGFSAEDAWQTLRALLKDKYTTLRRVRPRFIKGALANPTFGPALPALRTLLPGFTDEPSTPDSIPTAPKALARRLWDDLLFFASTLYPKFHALARALLAYRLLYLRLHNTSPETL